LHLLRQIQHEANFNSALPFAPIVIVGALANLAFHFSHTQNDVQMVSMLYRTHKALQPQFKVPSLYAFDALARAARSHALKHGVTGDAQSGNSATFLLKLEAVLEGLFLDMMSCGVPEGKVSKNHMWLNLLIMPGRISLC